MPARDGAPHSPPTGEPAFRPWVVAAFALVAMVIVLSGRDPWRFTVQGLVVPPDLAQDVAAARVFVSNRNPYEDGIARTHAELMQVPEDEGYTHFPHPPLLFLALIPVADSTLRDTASMWFGVSVALLFVLAAVLAGARPRLSRGGEAAPRPGAVLLIFAALLAWPPVLYNLGKGQWSIALAVLLALSWHFYARGHSRLAGACAGLGAAVKLFPLLLGAFFALRRAPRAVLWLAILVVAALTVPLMWMGPGTVPAFLRQSQSNLAYWETFPAVTYSIHGALARLLVGGPWARPLLQAPLAARALGVVSALVLIAMAMKVVVRSGAADGHEGARFAAWTALLVLLNPLSMSHSGVLLALPIVLTAGALTSDSRVWPRLAWTAGVVLVSISGHTLNALVSDPIEPWEGLAITALPMWGTLSLFVAAIAVSAPSARQATPLDVARGALSDSRRAEAQRHRDATYVC